MKKKKRRTQSNTSLSDSRNRERSVSVTVENQEDSPSLGSEHARPNTETPTPCIILESASESKMEAATEVLRELSGDLQEFNAPPPIPDAYPSVEDKPKALDNHAQ